MFYRRWQNVTWTLSSLSKTGYQLPAPVVFAVDEGPLPCCRSLYPATRYNQATASCSASAERIVMSSYVPSMIRIGDGGGGGGRGSGRLHQNFCSVIHRNGGKGRRRGDEGGLFLFTFFEESKCQDVVVLNVEFRKPPRVV